MAKSAYLALSIIWTAAIYYLALSPVPSDPTAVFRSGIIAHFSAYAIGTFLYAKSLDFTSRPIAKAFFIAFFVGLSVEIIQGQLGYRHMELLDIAVNTTGALIGVLVLTKFPKFGK